MEVSEQPVIGGVENQLFWKPNLLKHFSGAAGLAYVQVKVGVRIHAHRHLVPPAQLGHLAAVARRFGADPEGVGIDFDKLVFLSAGLYRCV